MNQFKHDSLSQIITTIFLSTILITKYLNSTLLIVLVMSIRGLFGLHILFSCFLLLFIIRRFALKPSHHNQSVYLVDFSCFKPPNSCKVPFSRFKQHASLIRSFDDESVEFMAKVLTSSGLGEDTYLPPALHCIPPKTHQREYIEEAEMALFPIVDDLLSKAELSPLDIDILITNCSGFCPSPSLSSILVNKYSMRSDVKSYSLSGMGCSAGVTGIDLARNLLKTSKDSYALVVTTEVLSAGWYSGRERSMLLLNCLFRMGSAAALLTNKKQASKSAKYKLLHTLRTQTAFEDKAYSTAIREEDGSGKLGVAINKALLQAAGDILKTHLTILGSQLFPFAEKLKHFVSIVRKKLIDKSRDVYTPSFKIAIQHFCLPTSGRALIQEIAKGLKLEEVDIEPALMTLHRFGNQSSSSMWYELAYMEAKERVKRGDKVWQLGMGTGPKCNSLVWECLRASSIVGESRKNPWSDCIHLYPI